MGRGGFPELSFTEPSTFFNDDEWISSDVSVVNLIVNEAPLVDANDEDPVNASMNRYCLNCRYLTFLKLDKFQLLKDSNDYRNLSVEVPISDNVIIRFCLLYNQNKHTCPNLHHTGATESLQHQLLSLHKMRSNTPRNKSESSM